MHELFDPDQVFRIVDIAAVVANGLLGGAVARAFRFDIVGFLLLAVTSCSTPACPWHSPTAATGLVLSALQFWRTASI